MSVHSSSALSRRQAVVDVKNGMLRLLKEKRLWSLWRSKRFVSSSLVCKLLSFSLLSFMYFPHCITLILSVTLPGERETITDLVHRS